MTEDSDTQESSALTEVEFKSMAPEDMLYDDFDIDMEAMQYADVCLGSIPEYASPAQARILTRNFVAVLSAAAALMQNNLDTKGGRIH